MIGKFLKKIDELSSDRLFVPKIFLFSLFAFLLPNKLFARHIQDDANLLKQETSQKLEQISSDLLKDTGVNFMFRTEKRPNLEYFDSDSRRVFSEFIRKVPGDRGVLLYLQVEKEGNRGKVNFSSGFGLKGALDTATVRQILKDKILLFRQDLSKQETLIEGVEAYFALIRSFQASRHDMEEESLYGTGGQFTRAHLFWILIFLFVAFLIVAVFFVVSKKKCPRCGHKLHVSVRPLYKPESSYKRIKIIKCFDCNYFRKYLF